MDRNIIRQYLKTTFLSEATTPAQKLGGQIKGKNEKANKEGVNAIAKEMSKYEKSLTKPDVNSKTMAQNKFNYTDDSEKTYHEEMEIMNYLVQYDRPPSELFNERAIEAIEGSARMGNSNKCANVVEEPWGGNPDFGKNLVKRIKASQEKRNKQTPTSKMFGKDWEVVKDKGHKAYAFEGTKNKKSIIKESFVDAKGYKVEKGEEMLYNVGADFDRFVDKIQASEIAKINENQEINEMNMFNDGINPYNENTNKNKKQIKETMKRLKFKKEFNGFGNALKMIPEHYKVNKKTFEMTDGNESYRVRWEGSLTEGKAVILMASDKKMVNEDIQKMKHLMGYKSEETLGTVKGKDRINENKAFNKIYQETKRLMEMEDIDGQDAEKEAEFDQADISHAPEAKKHIQGSVSSDKGTKAPKPKEGYWDKISVPQAGEAKKHVQGSASSDKGTKAPKPKTGSLEDAVSHAPEAKKHVEDKKTTMQSKPKTGDWSKKKYS